MKVVPLPENFNPDITCLRCGAHNIPDNLVCGGCGANLPLVYDRDGKPRVVLDDTYRYSALKEQPRGGGFLADPASRGRRGAWLLRFGIILSAVLTALWIVSRR